MSKKTLLTLLFSLLLSLGILFILTQEREYLNFSLKKESKKAYKLHYKSNISFNKSITTKNSGVSLDANLNLRVFEIKKEYTIVGFELSNLKIHFGNEILERKLEKIYSEVIFVKLAKNGEFLEFILPRSRDDLKGLLELFSHFQIITKDSTRYETIENSFKGEYLCEYRVIQNIIYKSRIKYLSTQNKDHKYIFKNSKIEAMVAKDGVWLDRIEVSERVFVNKGNMQIAQSETTLNLVKINKAVDKTLTIYSDNRDIEHIIKEYGDKVEKNRDLSFWEEEKKSSQIRYIKANNITYETLLDKVSQSNKFQDYQELTRYLTLYPHYAKEVLAVVQNETSSLSAGLISVLQDSNTNESKKALNTIVKEEKFSSLNRERASIALGGVENPDESSIQTLLEIMDYRGDKDAISLSNSAILSLGRLSSRVNGVKYEEIKSQLSNLILNGEDQSVKRIAIIAAGNSKTQDYFQELKESLYGDSDSIRFVAIDVLGKVDTQESRDLLLQTYDDSNKDSEKIKILQSFLHQELDENIVNKMQNELVGNLKPKLKSEVIKYLCKSSKEFESSKSYLEKELPMQSNPTLIKLIIKSIR